MAEPPAAASATQAKRQPGSSIKPFVYLTAPSHERWKTPRREVLFDRLRRLETISARELTAIA